jgi:hypothetical protein
MGRAVTLDGRGVGFKELDLIYDVPSHGLLSASDVKLHFFGGTKVAQAAHIADPTGGATTDAEARTAIDAILVVLENVGLTASS